MFVIESTNARRWRWISAVVATREDAEAQVAQVPAPERVNHRVVEHAGLEFPVFMIEDRTFEFGGLAWVRSRLRALVASGDEDNIHFNVYAFAGPYLPQQPGRDEMGSLLHWHVVDSTLANPRAAVFDAELAAIAAS